MKKLYSFALLLSAFVIQSQNLTNATNVTLSMSCTTTGSSNVTDGDIFNRSTTAGEIANEIKFNIKNISASTQTFSVRRFDDLLNTVSGTDIASAHFCTGTDCYLAATTSTNVVLAAGATIALDAQLDEASVVGPSNIRYKVSVLSEVIYVTIKYNGPAGLKELSSYLSNVSAVYPNPSTSRSFIDVNANQSVNNVSVTVVNLLGAVVSVKQIDLDKGKNKIALDTETMESGIYFVSISIGSSRITKKITVSK